MSLRVIRKDGETWRECVKRVASQHGLARECLVEFDRATITEGRFDEDRCAWEALYEWDCLEFVNDR